MAGRPSGSRSACGTSAVISGMRLLRSGSRHRIFGRNGFCSPDAGFSGIRVMRGSFGGSSQRRRWLGLGRVHWRGIQAAAGRPYGSTARRKNLLRVFSLQVCDLLLDLGLELVGGTPEFVKGAPHLAGDLGQLLRPKDDEGQKEEEDRLRKTHALIILPEPEKRQSSRQAFDKAFSPSND